METLKDRQKRLPLENGIQIQFDQLAKWKKVLNENSFSRLMKFCAKKNKELSVEHNSGYDVFRGSDMDMFVQNNLMLENKMFKE